MAAHAPLSAGELLALFAHFLALAVFATGGAMALASDMHRYVVDQHRYITHQQFVDSIAIGQAAPGPNVLFVTVMGWQVAGWPGALATTAGLALPAFVFPMVVSRASRLPQFGRAIAAAQRGLAPLGLGLLGATALLLLRGLPGPWWGAGVMLATLALLATTRLPPVVLIAAAGAAGALIPW